MSSAAFFGLKVSLLVFMFIPWRSRKFEQPNPSMSSAPSKGRAQTVQALIRRRSVRRLIRAYRACFSFQQILSEWQTINK